MLSVDSINKLEAQNDKLKIQNRALETKFLEILRICKEPADNIAVAELQEKIKDIINGKNN